MPVDFQTLHIFTESCRKCPRIVTLIGLLEPEGAGETAFRKGGSCLLLHTRQHPADLNLQQERERNLCLSPTFKLTEVGRVKLFEKRDAKEVL